MKRVLVTRPRAQAADFGDLLRAAGFEPVFFPVIEIQPMPDPRPLEHAIHDLARFDWVIFTSANGVEIFWEQMARMGLQELPERLRVAAIGPKTAAALAARGARVVFMPEEYVAEAILPGLGEIDGRWFLLPRAEIARKALPEAILAAGGWVVEIAAYRTLPAVPDPSGLEALRRGVDAITFTSPSTVQNFVEIARQAGLDPLDLPGRPSIACIGPITAQAVREAGYTSYQVAHEYTAAGLAQLLSGERKSTR